MSLPFTSSPNQNPSAGASTSANLIDLRNNVSSTFPAQRSYALIPESEVEESCLGRPPFDVVSQFPTWIQKRHNSGESKLITLIEYYYKWLYCEFGSGYILDDEMLSIHDVDDTRDIFVDMIAKTYVPDLDLLTEAESIATTREFIKNIRQTFYAVKGTKQSIQHFFNTLYKDFVYLEVITPNDPDGSSEPLRLNSSPLNSSSFKLNEGISSQNPTPETYAYTVKIHFTDNATPLDEEEQKEIENLYRKLVHPVGTDLNFEYTTTNLQNID